jgi:selenophosphate synthase
MPWGVMVRLPELNPGGRPSTTVDIGSGLTVVYTEPLASVRTIVESVGVGVTSGRVVTLNFCVTPFRTCSISGVYADVARSLTAIGVAGTEVLNIYAGVVILGVGRT